MRRGLLFGFVVLCLVAGLLISSVGAAGAWFSGSATAANFLSSATYDCTPNAAHFIVDISWADMVLNTLTNGSYLMYQFLDSADNGFAFGLMYDGVNYTFVLYECIVGGMPLYYNFVPHSAISFADLAHNTTVVYFGNVISWSVDGGADSIAWFNDGFVLTHLQELGWGDWTGNNDWTMYTEGIDSSVDPNVGLYNGYITTAVNYFVALSLFIAPAFILGVWLKGGMWGILIGLGIGGGLGYVLLPSVVPIWLVALVVVGMVGIAYKSVSNG